MLSSEVQMHIDDLLMPDVDLCHCPLFAESFFFFISVRCKVLQV